MTHDFHGFCIAGTHSGAGKTTVTIGLLAALSRRGLAVQPFKCGPDYIDPGHHKRACGRVSYNLDTWMMGQDRVKQTFARVAPGADVAVVEGVMGLYDGASATTDDGSTAHVARLLDLPVVLVVDARAMARSIAAMVMGYATFMPGIAVAGVIANNVGSEKHARILGEALDAAGLPPLIGRLPRQADWLLQERHLGLIADTESTKDEAWFSTLADGMAQYLDMDRLLAVTRTERPIPPTIPHTTGPGRRVTLGVALDDAFHFYYADNLDMLERGGANIVPFSPLRANRLPHGVDGLYIGGGFPEMFARELAANTDLRRDIRDFAGSGGSIYAECGGLMYLCRTLTDLDGARWDMCGVLPADTVMENRRRRLGYTEAVTLQDGPLGPTGTRLRGHEFHWSSLSDQDEGLAPTYEIKNAAGTRCEQAGLKKGNVWASYIHVHFASNENACVHWLERLRKDTSS